MTLSGYTSNLHALEVPNNAASGKTKKGKTECLWTNF